MIFGGRFSVWGQNEIFGIGAGAGRPPQYRSSIFPSNLGCIPSLFVDHQCMRDPVPAFWPQARAIFSEQEAKGIGNKAVDRQEESPV